MFSLDGQQGYSSRVEVPALYDRPFSHQVRALDDSDSHKEQRLSYRDARCNWFDALSDVVNAQADAPGSIVAQTLRYTGR